MKVTDIIYQGGGFVATFDDGSVATGLNKINKSTGKLYIDGLNEAQMAALEVFNRTINEEAHIDARFDKEQEEIVYDDLSDDMKQLLDSVNQGNQMAPNLSLISSAPFNVPSGDKPKDVLALKQGDKYYAYMLLHSNPGFLVIFDVTDRENPIQVSYVSLNNGPNAIVGKNDHPYVYVCSNTGRLFVIDVNDPESPSVSYVTLNVNKQKFDVAIDDLAEYAYVADATGNGLQIVNIQNKSNPVIVPWSDAFNAGGVAVDGNYAYVSKYGGPSSLRIYDITNRTNPSLISTLSVGSMVVNIESADNHIYIGEYSSPYLYIIDVSNPASPSVVSTINTPGNLTNEGSAFSVGDHDFLYVCTNGPSAITAYDVTNKSNPQRTLMQYIITSGTINGSIYCDGNIFVPDYGSDSLLILSDVIEQINQINLISGRYRVRMPSGGTANRPSNPVIGEIFFDLNLNKMIIYNGSIWTNVDGSSL